MAYLCQAQARVGSTGREHGRYYYGQDGKWYSTKSGLESRYCDFVPYDYDERTLLTRIVQVFNYARSSFIRASGRSALNPSQASTNSSSGRGSRSSTLCGSESTIGVNIEMISSSPSPTLHGSNPSHSPSSYHGSYRSSRFTNSPHPYVKPPPAAAFPRAPAPTPTHKRPLSQSWASPQKTSKDASTQYTPLATLSSAALGKKRGTSQSPEPKEPPPEPALQPNTSPKALPDNTAAPYTSTKATDLSSNNHLTQSSSSSSASTRSHESSPKRARGARPAIKLMPAAYETCDTKDLVLLISNMLLELIRHNDEIPLQDGRLTRFHSRAPPSISVKDYLQRLTTHATLPPPILLSMVYYIDRLCSLYPAFTISSLTVHRFLITAATVASKGLSDSFWTNSTYARVGGVSLKELALLELEFLWRVEWRIVPKPEVLSDYYRSLVERSEGFRIEGERASRSNSKGSRESGSGGTGESGGSGAKGKSEEEAKMETK